MNVTCDCNHNTAFAILMGFAAVKVSVCMKDMTLTWNWKNLQLCFFFLRSSLSPPPSPPLSLFLTLTFSLHCYLNENNLLSEKQSFSIRRVKVTKSLGEISRSMKDSWFDHIDSVFRKIGGAIAGLRQVRRFVPQKTSITIHNSLIKPLLIVIFYGTICLAVCDKNSRSGKIAPPD